MRGRCYVLFGGFFAFVLREKKIWEGGWGNRTGKEGGGGRKKEKSFSTIPPLSLPLFLLDPLIPYSVARSLFLHPITPFAVISFPDKKKKKTFSSRMESSKREGTLSGGCILMGNYHYTATIRVPGEGGQKNILKKILGQPLGEMETLVKYRVFCVYIPLHARAS